MNRPFTTFELSLRKVGDSNPRYGKPARQFSKLVVSATHPTFLVEFVYQIKQASFSIAVAKVRLFSHSTKCFCNYFSEKMHFFCKWLIFNRGIFEDFFVILAISGFLVHLVQKSCIRSVMDFRWVCLFWGKKKAPHCWGAENLYCL